MSTVLVGTCPFCHKPTTVTVSSPEEAAAVLDWVENRYQRPLIQNAFPDLPLDEREAMVSGSHGPCFDAAFAEEFE